MKLEIVSNDTLRFSINLSELLVKYEEQSEIYLCILFRRLIHDEFNKLNDYHVVSQRGTSYSTLNFIHYDTKEITKVLRGQIIQAINANKYGRSFTVLNGWTDETPYSFKSIMGENCSEYPSQERLYRIGFLMKLLLEKGDLEIVIPITLDYDYEFEKMNTWDHFKSWVANFFH